MLRKKNMYTTLTEIRRDACMVMATSRKLLRNPFLQALKRKGFLHRT